MKLKQLRYFIVVVDCGSLSSAAMLVNVVQSALSRQIAQLEDEFRTKFLIRTTRGIVPTEAGLALYRHAKQILSYADATSEAIGTSGRQIGGRVKLGLPSSIAIAIAAPLIDSLNVRYPSIVLEVYEYPSTYLAGYLLNSGIDLAILVEEPILQGLTGTLLFEEALCFVQRRTFPLINSEESLDIHKLLSIPLVLPTQATTLRKSIDRLFTDAGLKPNIIAEASSIDTLLRLVARGSAGTIITPSALAGDEVLKQLRYSFLEPRIMRRAFLTHSALGDLSIASQVVRAEIEKLTVQLAGEKEWFGIKLPQVGN